MSSKVEEYYSSPALNQSTLKAMDKGAFRYRDDNDDPVKRIKSGNALIIGSAVDCLVTEPEDWVNYYVVQSDIPTKQMREFVETVAYLMHDRSLWLTTKVPPLEIISDAYEIVGIKNARLSTVNDKFFIEHYGLYLELAGNYDKTWLPKEDFELVEKLAMTVSNHPYTRDVFQNDYEKLYQVDIYFEWEGEECKALLDILCIDHENKKIIPYDLKTTKYQPQHFFKAIEDNRYDIQARWYTLALESEYSELIANGYTIEPFSFVVASKANPELPVKVPLNIMNPDKLDEELKRLLGEYKYYQDNGYGVPKEIAENEGVLTVNKYY